MKVLCLIDSLGFGGAQRQLCTLAVLLKKQGLDVSMLTYYPLDFFLPLLQEAGIECQCLQGHSVLGRIPAIRRALRHGDQDVVLAFLEGPCFYAELAGIPRRKWGLVVSERSAIPRARKPRIRWLRMLHRLADYVTVNSHTNRLLIQRSTPSLTSRLITVYNAVDLQTFSYAPPPPSQNGRPLRIAVAGRQQANKNLVGFIQAIALARAKLPEAQIQLDWYGYPPDAKFPQFDRDAYATACEFIRQGGLEDCIRLHGPVTSIVDVYHAADAVSLPSFLEGLPNTVCEAMACGRPILMSNVCDAGNLVKNGQNGFLFDPYSAEDMARAIMEFAALNAAQRADMGQRSRIMAEQMFDPARVAARYAEILSAAAARKRLPLQHWIPDVPDSAHRFLERT